MLRMIGAAAVLALAAANPAFAQGKGNGGDKGGGGKDAAHAGMDHGSGRGGQAGGKADKPAKPAQAAVRDNGRGAERVVAERVKPRVERVNDVRDNRGRDNSVERVRDVRGVPAERIIERTVVRDSRDRDWDVRRSGWDGDGDWDGRGRVFASVPGCPPGLAKKDNGCLPPGQARQRDDYFGYAYRPTLFGIPLRTGADYAYYNGYLVPVSGSGLSYIPLLGGALAVGQVWPQAYPTLQLADWQYDYYGFDDPGDYRYVDNVVYEVDPETAAIEAVAALLTGNQFVVGQPVPLGYDVYNVPGPYQDRYYDTDEALYRYADGRVYQIDPTTMLIAQAIDLVL